MVFSEFGANRTTVSKVLEVRGDNRAWVGGSGSGPNLGLWTPLRVTPTLRDEIFVQAQAFEGDAQTSNLAVWDFGAFQYDRARYPLTGID